MSYKSCIWNEWTRKFERVYKVPKICNRFQTYEYLSINALDTECVVNRLSIKRWSCYE